VLAPVGVGVGAGAELAVAEATRAEVPGGVCAAGVPAPSPHAPSTPIVAASTPAVSAEDTVGEC
jgi:hypothetical protein